MKTTLVLSGMLVAGLALVAGPVPVAQAATITVDTTADVVDANGGTCAGMTIADLPGSDNVTSLREAVCAANGTVGADVITFTDLGDSPDLYTLAIAGTGEGAAATGDLDITEDLTITGNGQTETIIQAGTDETNGIDRVFDIPYTNANATFEGVTIRHGNVTNSGGGINILGTGTVILTNTTVSGNTAGAGGGIFDEGATVTLTNTTVSGNSAHYGGGIFDEGATVTLTNSTVSGNTAASQGGGIYNIEATVNLTNSTVSGNTANTYDGGGIYNYDGTANLTNSTVSGNTANTGGGIYNDRVGATVNLTNTIVADQLAGGDCSGSIPVTSNDYNLDSDGSCNLTQPNDKSNNPSANLGPLQLNAPGNTATHALLAGSDAIDTGDCTGGTVTTDQRGVPRPQRAACDIGAFELEMPGAIPTVSEWGMVAMGLLVLTAGTLVLTRRSTAIA